MIRSERSAIKSSQSQSSFVKNQQKDLPLRMGNMLTQSANLVPGQASERVNRDESNSILATAGNFKEGDNPSIDGKVVYDDMLASQGWSDHRNSLQG